LVDHLLVFIYKDEVSHPNSPPDIDSLKKRLVRPKRAVVTAGMPYANGPVHLGHLAGALIPPDVYSRWVGMLIGRENVLFVSGTDDHGSTSELSALKAGKPIREFIDEIHAQQTKTLANYSIGFDTYTGTSRPECFPTHKATAQEFILKLYKNGMLEKKSSLQWFDPKLNRFLQDRFVNGKCPNPKCDNEAAYSDQCDKCGSKYEPNELINPRSTLSDGIPVLKETLHLWLDMWKVSETLREWIQGKEGKWRHIVFSEAVQPVLPSLSFDNIHEPKFKEIKAELPKHKSKYGAGKKIVVQFENKVDLGVGQSTLEKHGIPSALMDGWAHRSITRDVTWGIPMPEELGPELAGKTLYVWPDSLIAPISFSKVALTQKGENPERYKEFWKSPDTRIYQFLGQDNVFFYTLMQGSLWLGSQKDPYHLPQSNDFQLSDIFGCYNLMVGGEKMSKSTGNYYTGDQMLGEKGYSADQIRYFLALLSLPEKASNFDFGTFEERNKFLAGPMNAAFEKPISAVHSRFGGKVPDGKLNEKVFLETTRMIQRYFKSMEKAEYSTLLFAIENYARQINSMFTQFKPHDDRFPEESRRDALFSCFYVLKNIMIMLYPFVPGTMEKLRESLKLPATVFTVDELGTGISAGHAIGEKQQYFPAIEGAAAEE
jgi:methionyl-tRNA synthetase